MKEKETKKPKKPTKRTLSEQEVSIFSVEIVETMKQQTRKQRRQKNQTRKSRYRRRFQRQKGGLIEDYSRMFDIEFEDKWVLTGSEAVCIYASLLGLDSPAPNDVDVLYASKKPFRENGFNGFQRIQSEPMRSMTFQNNTTGQSFDVMVLHGPIQHYLVPYRGQTIRLHDPEKLYAIFFSELSVRGNKQAANLLKMSVLEKIIQAIQNKSLSTITGPHMLYAEGSEPRFTVSRSRFTRGFAPPKLTFNSNNNL